MIKDFIYHYYPEITGSILLVAALVWLIIHYFSLVRKSEREHGKGWRKKLKNDRYN